MRSVDTTQFLSQSQWIPSLLLQIYMKPGSLPMRVNRSNQTMDSLTSVGALPNLMNGSSDLFQATRQSLSTRFIGGKTDRDCSAPGRMKKKVCGHVSLAESPAPWRT